MASSSSRWLLSCSPSVAPLVPPAWNSRGSYVGCAALAQSSPAAVGDSQPSPPPPSQLSTGMPHSANVMSEGGGGGDGHGIDGAGGRARGVRGGMRTVLHPGAMIAVTAGAGGGE